MTNHPNRNLASGPDLAVIIRRNINYSSRNNVTVLPVSVHDEANPHMRTPAEYGATQQIGPVYNDNITTIGRAANRRQANRMLREEEKRLRMPTGSLRPQFYEPAPEHDAT